MSGKAYYDRTSESQPIGLKMRPGLRVQEIVCQSESWWVVKDPYDQQYHRYNEHEFAILNWLDGKVSFHQLREKFEQKFSPFRVSYQELTKLLREFFKKSVVVATDGGNGLQLHEYAREKRREQLKKKAKSLLAIQLRGWDPSRFIDATYPLVSWFFSKTMVRLNVLFVLSALAWLTYHYDQFLNRLPNLWSLFSGSNLVTLAMAIAATKVLHELGHAYANKRSDGECHEIGIMIFFFVPTLYCNTSDSWMLPDKWKRMAIGSAGVYVELVIFAAATFLWWFSTDGHFQDLCLNLMVICSISAAVTNGNPLLRYDGYFVLSDWLEIPNLSGQSTKEIRRQFFNRCLGDEREVDLWNSQFNKRVFLAYGIASFIYKVFLITAISYLLVQRFQVAGLASLGLVIASVSLSGLLVPPAKSIYQYFKQPGNKQHVRRKPLVITLSIALLLVALVTLMPLPFHVSGECIVELADQQTVFTPHPARIDQVFIRPGERVTQGSPIVQLVNQELADKIHDVETELEETELRLKYQLTPRQSEVASVSTSESSADSLATTRRKLTAELEVLRAQQESLLVRAPRDGLVYGLTIGEQQADTDDDNLNRIYGNPLHASNLGAWLERGDEICRIGDAAENEITLLIEQKKNHYIREGQPVTVLLASHTQRLRGRVRAVSLRENKAEDLPGAIYQESSSPLVRQVKQAATADKRKDIEFKDGQTLSSSMVQATVALDDADTPRLNLASIGKAKVFVGNRTVLWRFRQRLGEVFQHSL